MIATLDKAEVLKVAGISQMRDETVHSESDKKEFVFWETDELESPDGQLFDNIVHKADFVQIFTRLLPRLQLTGRERVLEMGAGHCWASCLVKRKHPDCYVVASDLSPSAIEFSHKYEQILNARLDEKWAFNCRSLPFAENQFDRIFVFAAFHHFGLNNDFGGALAEMVRVLKPQGKIILLNEPSTPAYLYRWAFRRVNRKREFAHVDEDVLILAKIRELAERLNCQYSAERDPYYDYRAGIAETVYYYLLSKFRFLQPLVPCTVNITLDKR